MLLIKDCTPVGGFSSQRPSPATSALVASHSLNGQNKQLLSGLAKELAFSSKNPYRWIIGTRILLIWWQRENHCFAFSSRLVVIKRWKGIVPQTQCNAIWVGRGCASFSFLQNGCCWDVLWPCQELCTVSELVYLWDKAILVTARGTTYSSRVLNCLAYSDGFGNWIRWRHFLSAFRSL